MRLPRYGIVFGHFECWDCGREWKSSEVIVRNWIAEEQECDECLAWNDPVALEKHGRCTYHAYRGYDWYY